MEGLPAIEMIKLSGLLLKFIGESKPTTSCTISCYRVFNVVTMAIALWFAFMNFFYVGGEMYVQALQSSILFAHALLKYLSLLIYKSNIRGLLNDVVNKFWNYRHFGRNVEQEIGKIHKTVERLQNLLLMAAGFGIAMYIMRPFLAASRGLLLESFVPRSNVLDAILLFSQFYYVCIAIPVVLGYDYIYFALCAHIVLQLRLLKYKINDALAKHNKETSSQISVCVRHHQFLFTVRWKMQKIYSITFLFHYVGTLVTTCVLLLELFLRRSNIMNSFARVITIPLYIGQFALYAFPAEQVTAEFTALSDAIYTSLWYKNTVSNQRMLLYVMTVAQRVHYLSGAGLIDINVETFESVFRKSFSFCAVFRNLIEK